MTGLATHPWLMEELVHHYSRPTAFMIKNENPKKDRTVWVYGQPPAVIQSLENGDVLKDRRDRRSAVALFLAFCSVVVES